jgi:hypothetical protein
LVSAPRRQHENRLARFGSLAWTPDPAERLADAEHEIAATRQQLTDARARISQLTSEPALLAQPAERLAVERSTWCAERDGNRRQRRSSTPRSPRPSPGVARPRPVPPSLSEPRPSIGPSRCR